MHPATIDTVIFDLGGVLIDWNPRYVYRTLFTDEAEMEHFLATICTPDWNDEQDAGRPMQEATELLVREFPQHESNIRAYYGRWEEMLGGAHWDTVALLEQVKQAGRHRLLALTNWSHETFPVALREFAFLHWFEGIVVSGAEKSRKPFPEIYRLLLRRYDVNPANAIFIDDNLRNVEGARACGIYTIHFQSAEQLKGDLQQLGVL